MPEVKLSADSVRFGEFELSADGELFKAGQRQRLAGQPIKVLQILLEQPGTIVTREELQKRIWPGDSFGDFEHGLNAAVQRLRDVLSDSAATPTFIETIPRRGYRFIAPAPPKIAEPTVPFPNPSPNLRLKLVGLALLLLVISGAGYFVYR